MNTLIYICIYKVSNVFKYTSIKKAGFSGLYSDLLSMVTVTSLIYGPCSLIEKWFPLGSARLTYLGRFTVFGLDPLSLARVPL